MTVIQAYIQVHENNKKVYENNWQTYNSVVYYIHRQVQHTLIQVNKKDLQNFKKVLTKVNENDILILQGKQYKTLKKSYRVHKINLYRCYTLLE